MWRSLLIAGALLSMPQEPTAQATGHDGTKFTQEFAVLGGFATGKVFDQNRTPVDFVQLLGRWAIDFPRRGNGALRGHFGIVVEGVAIGIDQEPRATGGGINLLFRYAWAAGRWRPIFMFGAGVVFTDERVPPGETTRNFTPQGGGGLQYFMTDRLAIGGEYRFHHLSNNSQTETNPGMNSHLVLFGVSWYR